MESGTALLSLVDLDPVSVAWRLCLRESQLSRSVGFASARHWIPSGDAGHTADIIAGLGSSHSLFLCCFPSELREICENGSFLE